MYFNVLGVVMCSCTHVLMYFRGERKEGREGGREGGRKEGRERERLPPQKGQQYSLQAAVRI
jgi:hypothetical protein